MIIIGNQLGNYLRELRGNLSLRDTAKKIGISHTYLRDLELGKKTDPSNEVLSKLADSYNVSILTLQFKVHLDKIDQSEEIQKNNVEEYERSTHLMNLYFKAVVSWSEDKLLNEKETIMIRQHFYDLLLRYKTIIEGYTKTKYRWELSKETYSELYKDLTDEEIREKFLKSELDRELHEASEWINAFPNWIARNENKE
ncbi:helix-turn-helix transcriptional regulator [Schinkia azotoformans]|uniref:helix-turn-helix domain-containing protein n=1 Tax=Schinkia azotoformans TaxID=1454 RepID=UPI002DB6F208|nr:helix-turn-helix transcriptional regulator [Schinkia azotoformans]MEC1723912.1 helix-turn-helix transcriptional regulator [Schinkia azotoformans]